MEERVYTAIFSDEANTVNLARRPPWGSIGPSLSVTGGNLLVARVSLPRGGGRVQRVVVKQRGAAAGGGTAVGFAVDLVTSTRPFGAGVPPISQTLPYTYAEPVELYQVLTQITQSTAGSPGAYRADQGTAFVNQDSDSVNQKRELYLVITPTGAAGATKWDAAVDITY